MDEIRSTQTQDPKLGYFDTSYVEQINSSVVTHFKLLQRVKKKTQLRRQALNLDFLSHILLSDDLS